MTLGGCVFIVRRGNPRVVRIGTVLGVPRVGGGGVPRVGLVVCFVVRTGIRVAGGRSVSRPRPEVVGLGRKVGRVSIGLVFLSPSPPRVGGSPRRESACVPRVGVGRVSPPRRESACVPRAGVGRVSRALVGALSRPELSPLGARVISPRPLGARVWSRGDAVVIISPRPRVNDARVCCCGVAHASSEEKQSSVNIGARLILRPSIFYGDHNCRVANNF